MMIGTRAAPLLGAMLAVLGLAGVADAFGPKSKPHVVFFLVDDYGWANAGWHNDVESGGKREVGLKPAIVPFVRCVVSI